MTTWTKSHPKKVRITMEFAVLEEDILKSFLGFYDADTGKRTTPEEAIADLGLKNLGEVVAEAVFHGNPGIHGYNDYGIELIESTGEEVPLA
jgi:hypothetical protein